jgi:signal transduction histidine kinase
MLKRMPQAAAIEDIQREEMARLFGSFALLRLLLIPIPITIAAWCVIADRVWWRRQILVAVIAVALSISLGELLLYRRGGIRRIRYGFTLSVAGFGLIILTALTGGLESPFIIAFIPISLLVAGFVTSRKVRLAFTTIQVVAILLMTACALGSWIPGFVPQPFGGGARAGHVDALLAVHTLAASVLVMVSAYVGRRMRLGLESLFQRADDARVDALRAHAEQAQLLTTFSGEIAHELKNPLASVKGLAALMAPEQQGKNAERIAVLRREVDRMQTILDEFLNFSRPLGPLARETVDLVALCQSVAALHEGQLRGSGITLDLEAAAEVSAPCDPRKVKQVMINLLQNAIEASPNGGELRVELRNGDDAARVRFCDRGTGLDAAIAAHAFDPGATTKAKGSGLGLTIARTLARQHGGDLTLANREGGGCVAELTLPKGAA